MRFRYPFRLRSQPTLPTLADVNLERPVPIHLAGRYVKFSRRLAQTPWIVDGKRKLPSSVEELILAPITEQFGANSRLSFIAAGREDVDARYDEVFFSLTVGTVLNLVQLHKHISKCSQLSTVTRHYATLDFKLITV